VRRESAQVFHELLRRLLVFVDKDTRAPLLDAGGAKLDVVRIPYQKCTYRLDGSVVQTEVRLISGLLLVNVRVKVKVDVHSIQKELGFPPLRWCAIVSPAPPGAQNGTADVDLTIRNPFSSGFAFNTEQRS
jgi:hypothetical protein